MNCFHILQGTFWDFMPNWFDWFSVIIGILSIFGGYWIATRIYSNEKRDKRIEEKELLSTEVSLFKNSLAQLNSSVANQIQNLKEYIEKQDFRLEFNQGINADFLHFIDVKFLYKDTGVNKQEEIQKLNELYQAYTHLMTLELLLEMNLEHILKSIIFMKTNFIHIENFFILNILSYVINEA
ncbi:MAG: hypothetical protein IPK31_14505 [Chitinophagaceae bacterium]|nr:hypothetical protein [Chitinophagaceae bacterium]